ncbi:MAG: siderophore-interacting protein [Actinoplanes sp.]
MTYQRRGLRQHLATRVRSVTDVTGHLREVELAGPELARLRCRPGAHLVVRIPDARRVYSIWRHDPGSASLALRVVLHDAGGPGCAWVRGLAAGDRIEVEAPRSKITLDETAAFHLFVGDETGAVPLLAMRAALHHLSRGGAAVHGVFEAAGPAHEVPGADAVPALPWVHRGTASAVASRVLLRAVQALDLPSRGGVAYVAGESETCRLVQRHLVEQRGWSPRQLRVQQQWAAGRPGFGAGRD